MAIMALADKKNDFILSPGTAEVEMDSCDPRKGCNESESRSTIDICFDGRHESG